MRGDRRQRHNFLLLVFVIDTHTPTADHARAATGGEMIHCGSAICRTVVATLLQQNLRKHSARQAPGPPTKGILDSHMREARLRCTIFDSTNVEASSLTQVHGANQVAHY